MAIVTVGIESVLGGVYFVDREGVLKYCGRRSAAGKEGGSKAGGVPVPGVIDSGLMTIFRRPLVKIFPSSSPNREVLVAIKEDYNSDISIQTYTNNVSKDLLATFGQNPGQSTELNSSLNFGSYFNLNSSIISTGPSNNPNCPIVPDASFIIKEKVDLLVDFCGYKDFLFFLFNSGKIVVYSLISRKKYAFPFEEKWWKIGKSQRTFDSLAIDQVGKWIAVAGTIRKKEKQVNNLFLYSVQITDETKNNKESVKLDIFGEAQAETNSKSSQDKIHQLDISTTLNGMPVIACVSESSNSLQYFTVIASKLQRLIQPVKIHTEHVNSMIYSSTDPGRLWTCGCDFKIASHHLA